MSDLHLHRPSHAGALPGAAANAAKIGSAADVANEGIAPARTYQRRGSTGSQHAFARSEAARVSLSIVDGFDAETSRATIQTALGATKREADMPRLARNFSQLS